MSATLEAAHAGRTAVVVFGRAPVPGAAKTRLIPALGEDGAARLYRRMLEHTVGVAVASGLGPVSLYCSPDVSHDCFRSLAAATGCSLAPQRGSDLGERMHDALSRALADAEAALLVGSDCPFIDTRLLRDAAEAITRQCPWVLTPALDGGYVLIGTNSPSRVPFEAIPWGTSLVMARTRRRMLDSGLRWHETRALADIDRPEDLALLSSCWLA